jgi:hypothetical protein
MSHTEPRLSSLTSPHKHTATTPVHALPGPPFQPQSFTNSFRTTLVLTEPGLVPWLPSPSHMWLAPGTLEGSGGPQVLKIVLLCWRLMPVIPATQEAEIRKIIV